MTLENLSSRDKFWFHPILPLRYGTTSPQMHMVLDSIRSLLKGSRHAESNTVRVRFLRFGLSSLDVGVFAYILARDWNEFLEIQEKLLLRILECIESNGVQIPILPQTLLAATYTVNEGTGRALIKAPVPDDKPSDKVT